ncbi:hypothetical protein [Azospirillum sp. ST 5-10]|uniref:hypothetical protein n=1 Tax=unclassified Azospirillum TaxID=2630922 RepID=UPI003F49E3A4
MPCAPTPPVVVDVPVTLRIEVAFPGPVASDAPTLAQSIAHHAAEFFAHASHAEIRAFNTVRGLHDGGTGEVRRVTSILHDTAPAA